MCLAQMAHYNEEEHKGMVPCLRRTRPGIPCGPEEHCDPWNRTCVDQKEGSDHYQCGPEQGVGLPLSAQLLQSQFCDSPA